MSRRMVAAGIAAGAGLAAVLTAGYAAAGPSGLVDAASVAAAGVLIAARMRLGGQQPPPVRPGYSRPDPKRPAVSEADFPAYQKILSQVPGAQLPGPHHERALRSMLARLATALDRPQAVAADLGGPSGAAGGPGLDLAALERILTRLEER